ncbi:TPA: glycosyltransferase family 4 protein [Candidatus Poribacteria bacterium]|nr:glycosyltransferase family 4 protein [Candidatus Poribacteria bacterium]
MRILMLNYEFPPIGGGGSIVNYYLARNMAQWGHDVYIITSRFRDLPEDEELDGFKIHRVPVLRKRTDVCQVHEMLTYVLSASLYSLRFARKFQPDIVQVFFGIPSGPVAYLLKKLYNLPYIVFLGGRDVPRPNPDPPHYRLLYPILSPAIKSIWGNAETVVACSYGLRELAWKTDHKAKIEVIPDGIDLSKFYPVQREAEPTVVRLLTIARLIPRKGVQYLILAIAEVIKNTQREFEVEIVGDGPMREELLQLAAKLKVSHKLNFVGAVPYEQLAKYYQKADIFVLSSLAEGMPLVVLEAMASGLPIIASKVQGIEDLVKVNRNGYLFTPGNWRSLARHIVAVLNDGRRRLTMGQESIRLVQKYDWSNIAKAYLEIYRHILFDNAD